MGNAVLEAQNAQTQKKHEFLSLRQAAVRILATAPHDGLTSKQIYDQAVKSSLLDSTRKGKTPWATLAALFYTDIKNKSGGSTFFLVSKGHFALTDKALSGKVVSHSADTTAQKGIEVIAKTDLKFPEPTTDMRGRSLSPNTHAHGKKICNVRQKTKNGTLVCRGPPNHDGGHKFEPFSMKGNKKNRRKA